ncbi:MAG: hypothetical protein A2Y90_06005 [Chloroflexi bacterium RBG_13_52_12]|nr:MAG: hypothetical protein A2Y90_06005 [Chloroflexi bacterium RBG_13_52_12]
MATKKSGTIEIKEIMYFEKPGMKNIDPMIEFVTGKIKTLDIKHVMIAWSSGYTLKKFLEATKNLKPKLNIAVVTNPKGGTIGKRKVSIDDVTREELEKKGIKVCYLNDDLHLGEPMSPSPEQKRMRDMLLPWLPAHIDPLSMDAGVDLSLLLILSQGFRVCVGCLVLAVNHGLIPEGERVLCLAGKATAIVLQSGKTARTCYVKEILGFERNSDWLQMPRTAFKGMVAITKPE